MLQLILKIIILSILLVTGVESRAWGAQVLPGEEKNFLRFFPEAKKDGACYLFRLDGCEIVAATNTYAGGQIDMLFVHGGDQNAAKATAEKLKSDLFLTAQVRPFRGKEPWVALILPQNGYGSDTASRVIGRLIATEDKQSPLEFLEWRGKQLRVRTEHSYASSYFSTSYSSGRKSNGEIELTLDMSQPKLLVAELRVVKGKLTPQEVAIFITRTLGGVYSSPQNMSKKELAALRKTFSNANIVSYSTGANSCIVSAKKTYRYGTIDAVRESLRSQPKELASFDFPAQESMMPSKRREMLAAEQEAVKKQETQAAASAAETSSASKGQIAPPRNFQEAVSRYVSVLNKL